MDVDIKLDAPIIDINLNDDQAEWDELVREIVQGNVIPVIGPDFLIESEKNISQQIIDYLARLCKVTSNPKTFSQLVYDKEYMHLVPRQEKIYDFIFQYIEQVKNSLSPSKFLLKLLGTKKFPFIITTCFSPFGEIAMRQVWGNDVRVLQYRNDPSFDLRIGEGDVQNENDMLRPTVYYMFGRYARNRQYVVTDMDMMSFCRSWLNEGLVPRNLSAILKRKYLLVLGNNYSDWLFRFILYSLRGNKKGASLLVSDEPVDSPFIQFLKRLETFVKNEPEAVVDRIVTELGKVKSAEKQDKDDVFISYSRSDLDVAQALRDKLEELGLKVWFDSKSIPLFSDWKREMMKGIKNSRLFVPLLTHNIEQEFQIPHEYRSEWDEAVNKANMIGGVDWILPVAEKGFDFYNINTNVPDRFKDRNAAMYSSKADLVAIAQSIKERVEIVRKLEK